ncbi:Ribosomal RNA-processing protein 12, partial [Fusarium oxysporum f. sp. albedinis]
STSEAIKNHLHNPQLQRPPTNKPSPKVDAGIPFPRVHSHPHIPLSRQPILCQASYHGLHAPSWGISERLFPA